VTFILGMRCTNGLVLCSDSEESDGYVKKNVQKLFQFEQPGKWGVAFGCSGSAAACSNFGDRLLEQLQEETAFNRRTMEKTIEAHIHYMRKEYPEERLQVVLGLYSMSPPDVRLYLADTNNECLSVHSDYACAGMDVSLARFLLDSVFDNRVNVRDGMYLAAFITHVMKQKAASVGGPTQLLHFRMEHPHWFAPSQKNVQEIEEGGFIGGKFSFEDLEVKVCQFFWSRFPHHFREPK
jgi:20S proteasome alpha/beta subunit